MFHILYLLSIPNVYIYSYFRIIYVTVESWPPIVELIEETSSLGVNFHTLMVPLESPTNNFSLHKQKEVILVGLGVLVN